MGMYDRLFDADGVEYQTKAFGRGLNDYHIGDEVPAMEGGKDYQLQLHDPQVLATVLGGRLHEITRKRRAMPLFDNHGRFLSIEQYLLTWTRTERLVEVTEENIVPLVRELRGCITFEDGTARAVVVPGVEFRVGNLIDRDGRPVDEVWEPPC